MQTSSWCEEQAGPAGAWYAVHVRSRWEKRVHELLCGRGVESFLPTYDRRSQWADRIAVVKEPLFPGYVFCHHTPARRAAVLTTPGVVHIVGTRSTPVVVVPEEIAAVREIVASGLPCRPVQDVMPGMQVQLTAGPLKGVSGVVVEVRNTTCLRVSVNILQRSVLVAIAREWVEGVQPVATSREKPAESGRDRLWSRSEGPHHVVF